MTKRAAVPAHPRLQVFFDRGPGSASLLMGECIWVASHRTAAFEWSKDAVVSGLNLSPLMMPNATGVQHARHDPFSGIHPLFSDSIPDGFGLPLMNKGLQVAGYDIENVNPLHRLAWVGERGVGALTYKPVIDATVDAMFIDIFGASVLAAKAEEMNFKDIPKQAIRTGGSGRPGGGRGVRSLMSPPPPPPPP